MIAAVNGELRPAPAGPMAPLPAARGVFETVLLLSGRPVFLEDHWRRFEPGCRWHGFEPPVAMEGMDELAVGLASKNGLTTGVLRFAAWRTDRGVEWRVETGPVRGHMKTSLFRVTLGPALPPATADRRFKNLARGPWQEALRLARAAGWDEALLPDRLGRMVDGCVTNILFVRDGCLHTPADELGPLPGVMRGRVLALARSIGLTVREVAATWEDVERAPEVWLSNSLIGLRRAVCRSASGGDGPGPVLARVRAAWISRHGWDPAAEDVAT